MKCPKCGGAPKAVVLASAPPQLQCSHCYWTGTYEEWSAKPEPAHAERLQAARDEAATAESKLYDELRHSADHVYITMRIAKLIDAKVELALLERGGG